MNKYDSLGYCLERAEDYLAKAKEAMAIFKDSPPREALFAVADYVIVREK
jgi:geranylgeranyl pyrophosphate synthase